jgi:hypothetical protein
MPEDTDTPPWTAFELQCRTIEGSHGALEQSVEFQRQFGETLVDAMEGGAEANLAELGAEAGQQARERADRLQDRVDELREQLERFRPGVRTARPGRRRRPPA